MDRRATAILAAIASTAGVSLLVLAAWWTWPSVPSTVDDEPTPTAAGEASKPAAERSQEPGSDGLPEDSPAPSSATERADPGLIGAVRAVEAAGLGHERRCELGVDGPDLDRFSELLPSRELPDGRLAVVRREPTGHRLIQTSTGPVELTWTESDCTIQEAFSGSVSGEVVGLDGSPVEGARVRVCADQTLTDASGRYTLTATLDGSAPLDDTHAWCTLAAFHPDHGTSTTQMVDLQGGTAEPLVLEHPIDQAGLQEQQAILQNQVQAVLDGEIDPDFIRAAEDAELLESLSADASLDAPTRRVLYEAARAKMSNAGENEDLLDALERGPGL